MARSIGLTWPRFDSAACFAALSVSRRYRPGALILESEFETQSARTTVIDFMLPAGGGLVRIVVGQAGRVEFMTEFIARFE
jgi:hypothetical protein